jgi:hypothetical protein
MPNVMLVKKWLLAIPNLFESSKSIGFDENSVILKPVLKFTAQQNSKSNISLAST